MSHRLQIICSQISQSSPDPNPTNVYVVAAKRTAFGAYMGKLSSLKGPDLAALCIRSALESIQLSPQQVESVVLGNVLSAGVGQAPARQAALMGGLPLSTTCTTVNKVCASGMKAIVYGAQDIQLGQSGVAVVGGFESMSNTPHMIMNVVVGRLRRGREWGMAIRFLWIV
jgi:acetyl-CoA C-acetyltransferase